jgi:hypothetical protein
MLESSPLDRLLVSIRELIRAEVPSLTFCGLYEYTVSGVNGATLACQPVSQTTGLPVLSNVPLQPSILGEVGTPSAGDLCLVQFVNGSPSRPEVISLGPTNAAGTLDASDVLNVGPSASSVALGAAQNPGARVTDTVNIYFPPGVTLTIDGTVPSTGGTVLCSLQLITDPVSNTPLPCNGIIDVGSENAFG